METCVIVKPRMCWVCKSRSPAPAYPVQQNETRINKTLRQKVNRKTEIISTVNHLDNTSEYLERGKEIIPENPSGYM